MPHKFKVGDAVAPRPAIKHIPAGTYQVTKLLPEAGGTLGYRINSANEPYERTALESELTAAPTSQPVLATAPQACPSDMKGQDGGGQNRPEKSSIPKQRGKKSGLPPRVPSTTGKLPNLELPRARNRFNKYIDFLNPEVKKLLLQSGWSPPLASASGDSSRDLLVPYDFTDNGVSPMMERDVFAAVMSEHTVSKQLWWAVSRVPDRH
jgi:hypothetical protein